MTDAQKGVLLGLALHGLPFLKREASVEEICRRIAQALRDRQYKVDDDTLAAILATISNIDLPRIIYITLGDTIQAGVMITDAVATRTKAFSGAGTVLEDTLTAASVADEVLITVIPVPVTPES